MGNKANGNGFSGGPESRGADNGSASSTISEDTEAADKTYTSTGDSENALRIDNGATVTLSNVSVTKESGDTSDADADFYGTNAGILAENGSTLTLTNASISTSASHGNGIFSYGEGTTVNISDSTITTTGNNSGGIMTTGGGTMNAVNLTVSTSGNSSAAIRSDRGGGNVKVSSGSYTSSGVGSPAIYSTADISADGAALSASNSEAVVIEGGNSVTLTNSYVSGNNETLNGQSTVKTNVLIYQSMSGDASEGSSSFNMTGGTLQSGTGVMFHVTNTTTTINLSGVTLSGTEEGLLNASADAWGNAGRNGGNVTLNASGQTLSGDVTVDNVSSLTLNLTDESTYTGQVTSDGNTAVTIEEGSTWTLTGNCTVSSLTNNGTINYNGYTITLSDGTVLGENTKA